MRASNRAGESPAPWRRAASIALLPALLLTIAPGASLARAEGLARAEALAQAASPARAEAPARRAPSDPGVPPPRLAPGSDRPVAPELGSGFRPTPTARGSRFMVATANPLATEAAWQVLAAGGTAVDAVVAAQMMLTLVEPQSSGIGGGAFLLAYEAGTGSIVAWEAAKPRRWRPTSVCSSIRTASRCRSSRPSSAAASVGVPGVVRMLEAAHHESGRTPWADLLQPAIDSGA